MRPSRRLARVCVVVAAIVLAAGGLGFLIAPHVGWATPFDLPTHVGFRGLTYSRQSDQHHCIATGPKAPMVYIAGRRVGSVSGYFTSSKAILEPDGRGGQMPPRHPSHLAVIDGSCIQVYTRTAH